MSRKTTKHPVQPPTTRPNRGFAPDPVIEAYKKDVDRTLLLENLKLTVDERFQKFEAFMQGVMDLRQAGDKFRQQENADRTRKAKWANDSQ